MKRLFALLSSPLYFLFPKLAYAQTSTPPGGSSINLCPGGQFDIVCQINDGNFGAVIGAIVIVFFVIAVIIALLWLIIGGIKWITSSGDSSKVEAARNQIIAAVIGLVVVFLSFFILNVLLTVFGVEGGLTNLTLPRLDELIQ